ncbi:MAG: acyltransferase [Planctomycetes bacterium]|nr:acyltransferase [Planctomycetota bacterium]
MTAVPTSDAAPRVPELDGVRGIAIVAVVAMHATLYAKVDPRVAAEPLARAMLLGWSGVDLFFVLSGFLITGILVRARGSRHYFRNFYARRALRIFPLYWLILGLLLFVLERPPTSGAERASYLLYWQNWAWIWRFDAHPDLARTITWSLAVEEQFYLVWPAVVLLVPPRLLPRLCGALIVAAIALRFWILPERVDVAYFLTPCRLDALAAGACLAVLPPVPAWAGRSAVVLGLAGLATVAVATGSSLPGDNAPMQAWGLVAALTTALGVVTLARRDGLVAAVCRNRVLRSFGRYSYCIYLVHVLVVQWFAARLVDVAQRSPETHAWLTNDCPALVLLLSFTGASLATVWGIGWLSWHLFEQHFLALKRRFDAADARP